MFAFRNDCFTLILANGSLMEAAGPPLTSPVHGLNRYSGPSNGASTLSANTGGSACILNRDFGTDSAEPMDNLLLALEQQIKETCALVDRVLRKKKEREQLARKIERKEREIGELRAQKKREREAREQEEASRWPQQQEAIMVCKCCSHRETLRKFRRPFI